ncbi:MAG: hypothetical protein ACP5JG_05035 [Anaerolineae bacterium]
MQELTMNRPRSKRYRTAIAALFVLVAGAISVVNPLFEPTDEIRHYRYIRILTTEDRLPVQDEEPARAQSHHPPLYYALSALLGGWIPTPHGGTYRHPGNPFWGYRNWAVGIDNKLQYWHGPSEDQPFREGYAAALVSRWINVAVGALAVALTYTLAERILGGDPELALAASAVVGLNPQFIYLSGAMNNDILATLMGAAVLLACVLLLRGGATLRRTSTLGALYGLALLTKLHLAALGVVIAAAVALEAWSTARRASDTSRTGGFAAGLWRWLRSMALIVLVAGALAGWWFLRNLRLYGDLTGMRQLNAMWAGREAQGNFWAVRQGLPFLWSSLWGRFGYGQIPLPSPIYAILLVLCVVALSGLIFSRPARSLIQARDKVPHSPYTTSGKFVAKFVVGTSVPFSSSPRACGTEVPTTNQCYALLGLTVFLFVGVVIYYMMIQPAGAMGRFLFPALPAFAVLIVSGLQAWMRRSTWVGFGVTGAMVGLAAVALGGYLWPAVRYPLTERSSSPAMEVQVGEVARVRDVAVRPATVRPGEPVFVEVVWEPLQWTQIPYAVFVHLVDETGALAAQRDTWPGLSRAPTTSWRAGIPFRDIYRVDLPESLYSPNHLVARIGLYEPSLGRLPITVDGDPSPLIDTLTVGEIGVLASEGPWPNALDANFADRAALVGYTVTPRVVAPGGATTLTLYWQALDIQVGDDVQVFAQVLDEAYNVWGSRDGGHPDWTNGVISETREITLIPETPPGSYPIQVGLFSPEGRLPVVAPDGHYLDERVLLGPIRVTE